MNSSARIVVDILRLAPEGMSQEELVAAVHRKHSRAISAARVMQAVRDAEAAIVDRDGRLYAREMMKSTASPDGSPDSSNREPTALRAIAVDVESVVRVTGREPFTERHIFQIGGVRFGRDRAWCGAQRRFNAYLALEPDDETLLENPATKSRYSALKETPEVALQRFAVFTRDADILTAYNG